MDRTEFLIIQALKESEISLTSFEILSLIKKRYPYLIDIENVDGIELKAIRMLQQSRLKEGFQAQGVRTFYKKPVFDDMSLL